MKIPIYLSLDLNIDKSHCTICTPHSNMTLKGAPDPETEYHLTFASRATHKSVLMGETISIAFLPRV